MQAVARRILVVEDSEDVRRLVAAMLSQCGFDVLQAADGSEALQLLDRDEAPLHLVITDVIMPRMGGVELAAHIERLRPELPIVFMSGYTGDPVIGDVERDGKAFLAKPFTAASLADTVQRALSMPQDESGAHRV